MSVERLRDEILAKKPVIHTRFAEQFVDEPHDVESVYNHHYHTHIPLGDTSNFAHRLVERVSGAKTSKGAVVAPWGYGKTSTLIFTWRACEDAGMLAVPPFICSSLQDMLNATYGWLRFRLGKDWHEELQSVYQQYGHTAFDERVKAYAAQAGVTEADARVVLQQALDDGSFVPELAPINLMKFLEHATTMAKRAGFKGLVILADELQDFFGRSADLRGTIQRLREVVLWLAAHGDLSLGMVLCTPDTTEGMIQEDGQDILDRLKTDRLYISLRNIYSPDFPHQLWDRYVELYEVGAEAEQILDRHVLTATGQIATRGDLGRGPRTVVDVFQCALRHHDKTGEVYTPLALIDDFLMGQIAFDMQTNPIRFAVEEALSLLKKQATAEEHRKAIKLWAAFPEHGCPDEVLEAYGAKEAAYELSDMHGIHGPLLTYQSVGYTLRKLATFTPGGTAIERIARDFWLAYKEQDPRWAEAAERAFIDHILPRVFEKRRNAWGSWSLSLTMAKGFGGRLTGTSLEQYPSRVVDVRVATDPDRIEARPVDARSDFQFDFVLYSGGGTEPGRIEYVADSSRWIRFDLNLGSRALAGANLPPDLRNLKSSIHPNFLTPQLMLAFVGYAQRWEDLRPDNRILEGERGPVNAIVESMINYSVRVLFNEELKATFGAKLNYATVQIVREIFGLMCQAAWPPDTYHPLLTISDRAFGDYIDALGKLSLREKRGDVVLSERQKGKLASLFGIDSHKTFETRAKADYADLIQYCDRGGDQAEVQLQLHPLEVAVLKEMADSQAVYKVGEREVPALKGEQLLAMANAFGYRDEEAAMVLRLLLAREIVGKDDDAGLIYRLPAGPSPREVSQRLEALHSQVHGLPSGLVADREKKPLVDRLASVEDRFAPELEEEALEELAIEIGRVEGDLSDLLARKRQELVATLAQSTQEAHAWTMALDRHKVLDEDLPAGLDFRRHLIDLQEVLKRERKGLSTDLNVVTAELKDLHDRAVAGLDAASLPRYHEQYAQTAADLNDLKERAESFGRQLDGFVAWLKLLKESELLYASLSTMPDLRTRLTDEVVREIMRNFAHNGTTALADDVEHFRLQFTEISRERDARVAAGHEAFGQVKERLCRWLANMGVERSDFPARYSPVEHEQSYGDMYGQARNLGANYTEDLGERAEALHLDLLKARRIHFEKLSDQERQTLSELEQNHDAVKAQLEEERRWLEKVDLADATDIDEWAQKMSSTGEALQDLDGAVRRLVLRPVPPQSPEETTVMALLSGRREVDLTELVLSAGDKLDLDGLLAGLRGLYQGNQVTIKIQKRG